MSEQIKDHTFYLWDDTNELTRTFCGICGDPPEDHPEAAALRQSAEDGGV